VAPPGSMSSSDVRKASMPMHGPLSCSTSFWPLIMDVSISSLTPRIQCDQRNVVTAVSGSGLPESHKSLHVGDDHAATPNSIPSLASR
jgi:hypothetical protein